MITRLVGGLLAAATLTLAAACGTGTTAPTAADVTFVQGMLPHHEQAVAMSDLAATRSSSPAVLDLASRIRAGQGPEIDRMNDLLAAWEVPRSDTGMSGMSGMMGPDQMRQLEGATGPAFDRAFLTMMIGHHRGAVEMARAELAGGTDPGARALAQGVIGAQEAEIAEMQTLLGTV